MEVGQEVEVPAVYKDNRYAARCRREDLQKVVVEGSIPEALASVFAHRHARLWSSSVGLLGFVTLLVEALAGGRHSSKLLLGSWVAMLLAYPVVRRLAFARCLGFGKLCVAEDDDDEKVFADLARLDTGGPRAEVLRRTGRLELASLALPMAAVSLLAPLTIHLLVGTTLLNVRFDQFNAWILMSLVLVGHAHVTLLVFSVMHVVRVRRDLDRGEPTGGVVQGFWALLWTIAASAIPGAVMLFIPPLLVALTGLSFIPLLFVWVGRRACRERRIVELFLANS
jgi:hypothetical protein